MRLSNIGYYLFIFSVFLFPYYIFSSGNFSQDSGRLQPTHFIFILSGLFLLGRYGGFIVKNIRSTGIASLFIFVLYVITINTLLFFNTSQIDPLKYTTFYVFNLFIYILSVIFISKASEKIVTLFYLSIISSLLLQVIFAFTGIGKADSYRAIIFFNNPNQLGYFCIATASIIYFIHSEFKLKKVYLLYIGIFLAFILSLYSLSNAAILAFGSLFFLIITKLFFSFSLKNKLYIIALLILFLGLVIYIIKYQPELLDKIDHRLHKMGSQSDDTLEGRGISKLFDYYQYLVFGAGEGYFERFYPVKEIHSTLPSLIFNYGLFGFILFLLFIKKILKPKYFSNSAYLLPIFIYGIAHNGLRSPLLWVLLGFIAANYIREKKHEF